MTKSADSCRFGDIYWRSPYRKLHFLCSENWIFHCCYSKKFHLFDIIRWALTQNELYLFHDQIIVSIKSLHNLSSDMMCVVQNLWLKWYHLFKIQNIISKCSPVSSLHCIKYARLRVFTAPCSSLYGQNQIQNQIMYL